jgi:hypothetical protein
VAKVYVVQDDPNKNVLSASSYGELTALLPFRQVSYDTKSHAAVLREKLEKFNGEEDFLILIGDPVVIAITAAIIAENWSAFKVLKWDKLQHAYYPITIELE